MAHIPAEGLPTVGIIETDDAVLVRAKPLDHMQRTRLVSSLRWFRPVQDPRNTHRQCHPPTHERVWFIDGVTDYEVGDDYVDITVVDVQYAAFVSGWAEDLFDQLRQTQAASAQRIDPANPNILYTQGRSPSPAGVA
ncbi:hypothetical protein KDA23_03030 [Candidatus Saccharibacteria bacterium]|nr:hypothetical protein [Candidatus Saccharibacteria bacterium]